MMYSIRMATYNDCVIIDYLFARLLESDKLYDSNIKENLPMKGFFEKRVNDIDSIIFVAELNNEIIGYIYGYVRSDNKIKVELEAYIESLYVVDEYRKKGIATELINRFIEETKKCDVKYLFIENKVDNEEAKKLYEKLKFNVFIETRRKEI